jgi:hypothetical protein
MKIWILMCASLESRPHVCYIADPARYEVEKILDHMVAKDVGYPLPSGRAVLT